MALEVVPLSSIVGNYELTRIAGTMNSHVRKSETKDLLHARHLLGVISRHSQKVTDSERAVTEARRLHTAGTLGVYVLSKKGRHLGMATVDPSPLLRKQILPLPSKFAWGPFSSKLGLPGPEVTAWVAPGHGLCGLNNLIEAYTELQDPQGVAGPMYKSFAESHTVAISDTHAWTVEPLDAPQWIHTAIRKAGFISDRQSVGYYDDGESQKHAPPISRLYTSRTPDA